MDTILESGIRLIEWLQMIDNWILVPMQLFSTLGYEEFYLLITPAVFWCLNPALGLRLGIGLMLSGTANSILKLAFHGPRPYWFDPNVLTLSSETSFGIPSGHAQNAIVYWGLLARGIQKGWAIIAVIFLVLMISISRLYLGVHFPSDVAAGWLFGIILLWLIIRFEKPFLSWFLQLKVGVQIWIIFGASLGLILMGVIVRLALGDWQIPQTWIDLSRQLPGAEPIQPLAISKVITPAAALFGLSAGSILLTKRGWMNPEGSFWQRLARYLLGLVGIVVIWYGLDLLFPTGETAIALIFRFIRYTAVGFWITYLAPLVYFRLRITRSLTK